MIRKILPFLFAVTLILTPAKSSAQLEEMLTYETALELVKSGQFLFLADLAYPMAGGSVPMTMMPNELEIDGEYAIANITYFGYADTRSYDNINPRAIVFNGEVMNWGLKEKVKKERIIIKFSVRELNETFSCQLTIQGGASATLAVTGSRRSGITYNGRITRVPTDRLR